MCSYGYSWGDGFVADSGLISRLGLSNPRGWFGNDWHPARRYKTALAPHVYGECTLIYPHHSNLPVVALQWSSLSDGVQSACGSTANFADVVFTGLFKVYWAVQLGQIGFGWH